VRASSLTVVWDDLSSPRQHRCTSSRHAVLKCPDCPPHLKLGALQFEGGINCVSPTKVLRTKVRKVEATAECAMVLSSLSRSVSPLLSPPIIFGPSSPFGLSVLACACVLVCIRASVRACQSSGLNACTTTCTTQNHGEFPALSLSLRGLCTPHHLFPPLPPSSSRWGAQRHWVGLAPGRMVSVGVDLPAICLVRSASPPASNIISLEGGSLRAGMGCREGCPTHTFHLPWS
jgi:hypothetical protein